MLQWGISKPNLNHVIHNHGDNNNNSKKYTCAFAKSWNLLEGCLFMPYLQSVNSVLLLGEGGKQRLRQRVMTFD